MGHEDRQSHKFSCRGCGEDIVVGLEVDFEKKGHRIFCDENATLAEEVSNAAIVNLDANFLIPEDQQGVDYVFPRLPQLIEMSRVAAEVGSLVPMSEIPAGALERRPYRRADYAGEWRQLKKAWSLFRNGREKLSRRRVDDASSLLYPNDPLTDLADWVWRLTMIMCQPSYEPMFLSTMDSIRPLMGSKGLEEFASHYDSDMAQNRGTQYFELLKSFFAAHTEFGQVQFLVSKGLEIPDDHQASSSDFDKTKMFYGNAYETFTSLIDFLAFLNNLLCGRDYDKFGKLTLKQYGKLDKSSRSGPFSLNAAFIAICSESDNQVRNASHHGRLEFDHHTQTVSYHSGKGGTGPVQTIGYSVYLQKCVRIFLQTMTLMRVELILCNNLKIRPPL